MVIKTSPQSITTSTTAITASTNTASTYTASTYSLISKRRAGGPGLDMVGAELHGLVQDMGLDLSLIPFDIDLFPIS